MKFVGKQGHMLRELTLSQSGRNHTDWEAGGRGGGWGVGLVVWAKLLGRLLQGGWVNKLVVAS